ncbi:hypothetical protein PT974_01269 [Cladobotryum mycophilum]|uniref:Uncharacterized protein n=1 Tax=Cladobotryum mycophilum TaxID=491253 RepID=A0ABR0T4B3_9HYPO
MTALSVLLLAPIYAYRVVQNDVKSNDFQTPTGSVDADFIYVNLSATTLTTVSSWSSTVALLLLSFALGLGSYSVANSMLKASGDSDPEGALGPYGAGFATRPVGRDEMLKHDLSSPLAGLWLRLEPSLLVFTTDTWLHSTTKTINFTQFEPVATMPNVSFQLLPECFSVKSPFAGGCTLSNAATNSSLLHGESAFGLLSNLSTTGMVKTAYAYIGIPPRPNLKNIDYSAQTGAIPTHNSYYFAAAASANQNLPHNTASLVNDPGVVIGTHGSVIFVALCSTTVFGVEYNSVNGSVARFLITPSSQSSVNIVQGSQQFTHMADTYLQ